MARIGGDEFVVLLDEPGMDYGSALAHARDVGDKLLKALRSVCASDLRCTASRGLTVFSESVRSVDEMLSHADRAQAASVMWGEWG